MKINIAAPIAAVVSTGILAFGIGQMAGADDTLTTPEVAVATATPSVVAEPTETPEVIAEPTEEPSVVAEPTGTPEVITEPTETETPEVEEETKFHAPVGKWLGVQQIVAASVHQDEPKVYTASMAYVSEGVTTYILVRLTDGSVWIGPLNKSESIVINGIKYRPFAEDQLD